MMLKPLSLVPLLAILELETMVCLPPAIGGISGLLPDRAPPRTGMCLCHVSEHRVPRSPTDMKGGAAQISVLKNKQKIDQNVMCSESRIRALVPFSQFPKFLVIQMTSL